MTTGQARTRTQRWVCAFHCFVRSQVTQAERCANLAGGMPCLSQRSNWEVCFEEFGHARAGKYSPGFPQL